MSLEKPVSYSSAIPALPFNNASTASTHPQATATPRGVIACCCSWASASFSGRKSSRPKTGLGLRERTYDMRRAHSPTLQQRCASSSYLSAPLPYRGKQNQTFLSFDFQKIPKKIISMRAKRRSSVSPNTSRACAATGTSWGPSVRSISSMSNCIADGTKLHRW